MTIKRLPLRLFLSSSLLWTLIQSAAVFAGNSSQPSVLEERRARFDCSHYLTKGRDANLEAFIAGNRLHHTSPLVQNLSKNTNEDLELSALAAEMGRGLLTSFGRLQLSWLLNHPSLDPGEIRERQEALAELRSNPGLRAHALPKCPSRFALFHERDHDEY